MLIFYVYLVSGCRAAAGVAAGRLQPAPARSGARQRPGQHPRPSGAHSRGHRQQVAAHHAAERNQVRAAKTHSCACFALLHAVFLAAMRTNFPAACVRRTCCEVRRMAPPPTLYPRPAARSGNYLVPFLLLLRLTVSSRAGASDSLDRLTPYKVSTRFTHTARPLRPCREIRSRVGQLHFRPPQPRYPLMSIFAVPHAHPLPQPCTLPRPQRDPLPTGAAARAAGRAGGRHPPDAGARVRRPGAPHPHGPPLHQEVRTS